MKWTLVTYIVAIVVIPLGVGRSLAGASIEKVAVCRVRCAEKFLSGVAKPGDSECAAWPACKTCWTACKRLLETISGNSCDHPVCSQIGCKEACEFLKQADQLDTGTSLDWRFPSMPRSKRFQDQILVEWFPPVLQSVSVDSNVTHSHIFVYVWRKLNVRRNANKKKWRFMKMSLDNQAVFKDKENAELKMTAYNRKGKVAATDLLAYFPSDNYASRMLTRDIGKKNQYLDLNVSIHVEQQEDGKLQVLVTWQQPTSANYTPQSYKIHWAWDNCHVLDDYPGCDEPGMHYLKTTGLVKNQVVTYKLANIMYNSRYWVAVEWQRLQTRHRYFTTPGCLRPDVEFLTCYVSNETVPVPVWRADIICIQWLSKTRRLETIINWTEPETSLPILGYEVGSYGVSEKSGVAHLDGKQTDDTAITLHLKKDAIYQVEIQAVTNDTEGEGSPESLKLYINTSEHRVKEYKEKCAHMHPRSAPFRQETEGNFMYIPIILAGLGSAFIGTVITVVAYKKRCRFRDIIIHKVALAKSNSYKSTPRSSWNMSDTLFMMKDEWELDPRQIKLGSTLGQGAFGRVITGFYVGNKVAIKVLRDDAPQFYRADLLREICTMKQFRHPNIVSLVGSCTLSDPNALVMEYMPHGNLQTFLQKCEKAMTGDRNEVTYMTMNEMGEEESLILNATDFLSFGRQVTLAMEYLSENQFVHRDLAARNVLVGDCKIVKVSDFGLARKIHDGTEYHKLTNGKLPIKWMALESLCDRVYTPASDVWSFGILLWEIVSLGGAPYPNVPLTDLYTMLADGYRMDQPSNCSDELYDLMCQCWCENPKDRPTFTHLRSQLENLLSRDCDYLELVNVELPHNQSGHSCSDSAGLLDGDESNLSFYRGAKNTNKYFDTPDTCLLMGTNSSGALSSGNMPKAASAHSIKTDRCLANDNFIRADPLEDFGSLRLCDLNKKSTDSCGKGMTAASSSGSERNGLINVINKWENLSSSDV